MPEGPHPRVTHNTPFRAGKGYLYEGGLRVPLIVRGPGIAGGTRRSTTPVVNTDWLPTLLELAGAPAAPNLDGVSQVHAAAHGQAGVSERGRSSGTSRTTPIRAAGRPGPCAMAAGSWSSTTTAARWSCSISTPTSSESRDLSKAEAARTAALRQRLRDWRASVAAQENTPNPGVDVKLYDQLYVEFDPTRFDPLRADSQAWQAVALWRQRMNAAVKLAAAPRPKVGSQRSRATRVRPSSASRRKRRPAAAARSPGSSADTGSLARTMCVWTTRSVRVN